MKKTITLLCLLCFLLSVSAQDAFRSHRYDVFKVLPINDNNIVFIGNSITHMNEWWETFSCNHDVVNRGVFGTFSQEAVDHIEAVAAGKPAKVFFMVGTNDLGKNGTRDIPTMVGNVRSMVERLQIVSPNTQIFVQSILPSTYNRVLEHEIESNELLQAMCEELGLTYVDLWDDLYSITQNQDHTLDGLHLKASGYQIWAKKIEQYIGTSCSYPENTLQLQQTGGISNTSWAMRATVFSALPLQQEDVLFIGDEMVHSGEWHELLQSDKVKNRGTGWGYASPGMDIIAQEIPVIFNQVNGTVQPNTVVLYAGVAEVNGSASLDNIESKYLSIVQQIQQIAPQTKILVLSLLPTNNLSRNTNRVVAFNQRLQEMCAQNDALEYVDIYTELQTDGLANTQYFSGNYLRGLGYVKVAGLIEKALADPEVIALTEQQAIENLQRFDMRTKLGKAIVLSARLTEGDEVGQYKTAVLAPLNELVENAYGLLKNGGTAQQFDEAGDAITLAVEDALKQINLPETSIGDEQTWYQLYTPNRGNRYLTSGGAGNAAVGEEKHNRGDSHWKFERREDNAWNIINREDGTYLNPDASFDAAVTTSIAEPDAGWTLSYANVPGVFIIHSGNVQLNQTQSHLGWKIYNWSTDKDGQDREDLGCQFRIVEAIEAPTEEVETDDYIVHLSFARGANMDNSVVTITDKKGAEIPQLTASISATGADTWLTTNQAATDSILCVNINTNATTVDAPITYLLHIKGLADNQAFHNITFTGVALNRTGQWQGSTETRHCNFKLAYGEDETQLTEVPERVDESIMIAGGQPKVVAFEIDTLTTTSGNLTLKLDIYKGTNNLGCFYGLTGITLRGAMQVETGIGCVENNVANKSTLIYDMQGRVVNEMRKGQLYIKDGKKIIGDYRR